MKSCLLIIGAFVVCLGVGSAVAGILGAATGDDDLSSSVGTAVWLLSFFTIAAYSSLWSADPENFFTTRKGWRATRAARKLQMAEFRMGFVFAMIGGACASMAKGANVVITIVMICCALVGALIGFDIKRRVRAIRHERPDQR